MSRNTLNTLKDFKLSGSKKGKLYSLPALGKELGIDIARLPVSIFPLMTAPRSRSAAATSRKATIW